MTVGRWIRIALCSSILAAWTWLAAPAATLACTADVGKVQVETSLVLRNSVLARMVGYSRDPATRYVKDVTLDVERVLRGDWPSGRITVPMDGCQPTVGPDGHRLAIASMHIDTLSAYHSWTWDLDAGPHVQLMDPYDPSFGFEEQMTEAELVHFLLRDLPETATHEGPSAEPQALILLLAAGGGAFVWGYRRRRLM